MRMKRVLFLLVMFGVMGVASQASGAGGLGSYVEFKGGIYSPSAFFDLSNVDVSTTFDGDMGTGFDGEIAFGHYLMPSFSLEMGLGFFKGMGSLQSESAAGTQEANFNVVPLIGSAKLLVPIGAFHPYGELGIGAYFTKVTVSDNMNTFSGCTTFGIHTGAGFNVHLSPKVFLGLEGRYVWANPSLGGETIKLNDTEYTLNGFKLNGFTTTLGVGFSF